MSLKYLVKCLTREIGVDGKEYQVFRENGREIWFHSDTHPNVIDTLSRYSFSSRNPYSRRLRIFFGDTETGRDWQEIYFTTGYIGNSTGKIKIPLLIHNRGSLGGIGLLDHCIVKIELANKRHGGAIYQHPKYHINEDYYGSK